MSMKSLELCLFASSCLSLSDQYIVTSWFLCLTLDIPAFSRTQLRSSAVSNLSKIEQPAAELLCTVLYYVYFSRRRLQVEISDFRLLHFEIRAPQRRLGEGRKSTPNFALIDSLNLGKG